MNEVLGNKIRAMRQERDMSQKELAELIGVHQTAISFIENGVRPLSFGVAKRLASVLGISTADLVQLLDQQETERQVAA